MFVCDSPAVKTRPKHSAPFLQAIELQRLLEERARNAELPPAVLAQIARAWKELEYLKRDIKMKPKAKPVDVTKKPKAQSFSITDIDPSKL